MGISKSERKKAAEAGIYLFYRWSVNERNTKAFKVWLKRREKLIEYNFAFGKGKYSRRNNKTKFSPTLINSLFLKLNRINCIYSIVSMICCWYFPFFFSRVLTSYHKIQRPLLRVVITLMYILYMQIHGHEKNISMFIAVGIQLNARTYGEQTIQTFGKVFGRKLF